MVHYRESELKEHWRNGPIYWTRTSCEFQRTCPSPNSGVLIVVDQLKWLSEETGVIRRDDQELRTIADA